MSPHAAPPCARQRFDLPWPGFLPPRPGRHLFGRALVRQESTSTQTPRSAPCGLPPRVPWSRPPPAMRRFRWAPCQIPGRASRICDGV